MSSCPSPTADTSKTTLYRPGAASGLAVNPKDACHVSPGAMLSFSAS